MRIPRSLTLAIATALAGGAIALASLGTAGAGGHEPRLTAAQRSQIHQATKHYRDVEMALADGYVPVGGCTELPDVGGMGYHYLNPALAGDDVVDPAQPELLVYQAAEDGRLRLGAVEYFSADADQDVATDDDRPALFDQHPFEGPMPGHEPGMPIHYDLHVWLYRHNPAGQLASWNPSVDCP